MQKVPRNKSRLLRNEVTYQWTQLTEEDLHGFHGHRDDLVSLLEARCGFARPRAEREADLLLAEFQNKLRMAA